MTHGGPSVQRPAAHQSHMTSSMSRVPSGVPTGGQFTTSARPSADVSLDEAATNPEHGDGFCSGCGQEWTNDPDGSPQVKVHLDADGERDHDADADHVPVDEAEVMTLGVGVVYPSGRCGACGMGLDAIGKCFHVDCSNFDEDSLHADEGHTTSGEAVEFVRPESLHRGDRVLIDGVHGVVTSIDNDHKTTSIELDGDPSTITSYANDTKVHRFLGGAHPMPDDLVYFTDPSAQNSGWYRVDTFGLDEVVLRSRTGKVYAAAVSDLAPAPAPVFGPERASAARTAIAEHHVAKTNSDANPWSEFAHERLQQAARVRAQYSEYDDTFTGH